MPFPAALVHQHAASLGFSQVGIIPAAPSPHLEAYRRWIAAGMHGEMGYLARPDRIARREDLTVILPGARSLVIVALDYGTLAIPEAILSDPRRGRISNYAWGADYHGIMTPRLEQLATWLREQSGEDVASRAYVDTGAILERSHAWQAGLGFIGKNTMLIHPRRGPFLFLGELLTTLAFDRYDAPHRETMCGTCIRCLPHPRLSAPIPARRPTLYQHSHRRVERPDPRGPAPADGQLGLRLRRVPDRLPVHPICATRRRARVLAGGCRARRAAAGRSAGPGR